MNRWRASILEHLGLVSRRPTSPRGACQLTVKVVFAVTNELEPVTCIL